MSAGLPQLDPSSYVSQLFWLVVTFAVMYLIMRYLILPPVLKVMDERQSKIDGDLEMAKRLKEEADKAVKVYEDSIAQAHIKAAEVMKAENEKFLAFAKEEEAKLASKIKKHSDEAKSDIEAAKQRVMQEAGDMVSGLVDKIVYKLISERLPSSQVKSAVTKTMEELH